MIHEIEAYWDKQSTIWAEEKNEAWTQPVTRYWTAYFSNLRAGLPGNKVLELGTASGYFAHILKLAGFEVTAIDISPNMIEAAKEVSKNLALDVDYHVMDAQELQFDSNQFDLVFTRLMTWTIPDMEQCYTEAFRVLNPGGVFLNFDGDFGKFQFSQDGHEKYPADIMEQANEIKSKLEVSRHSRPAYDIDILGKVGFKNIMADAKAPAAILHQSADDSGIFKLQASKTAK